MASAPVNRTMFPFGLSPHKGLFIGMQNCSADFSYMETMNLTECYYLCGKGWAPYDRLDVAASIITWVIPLFVLVFNMQLSNFDVHIIPNDPPAGSLGAKRFLQQCLRQTINSTWGFLVNYGSVVFQVLGNPVDVIRSLLDKLTHVCQMRRTVDKELSGLPVQDRKHVSIVSIALDDLPFCDEALSKRLRCGLKNAREDHKELLLGKLRNASFVLSTTRVKSVRRSVLAIIGYAAALYAALTSGLASKHVAVHIPHTIALRELYYWLVPAIMLSSAAGAFPDPWTVPASLIPVLEHLNIKVSPLKPWNGASYTWRPHKTASGIRSFTLLVLALLSVGVAYAIAFCMSWYTPSVGFGCRTMTELGYFFAWLVSALLDLPLLMVFRRSRDNRYLFTAAYVKNAIFAVPMTIVLFTAFRGWWNSCDCWSARWTLWNTEALVPLNLEQKELVQGSFYFGMVGGALSAQLLLTLIMVTMHVRGLELLYSGGDEVRKYYEDNQSNSMLLRTMYQNVEGHLETPSEYARIRG